MFKRRARQLAKQFQRSYVKADRGLGCLVLDYHVAMETTEAKRPSQNLKGYRIWCNTSEVEVSDEITICVFC